MSRKNHATSLDPCARAHIHQEVSREDRRLVMLDHNNRVPQIPETMKVLEESKVVSLMEADARFIQNIQDTHEAGTDLSGQTDPLPLACRKGDRSSVNRQVIQPHVDHEIEPFDDLLENRCGDLSVSPVQVEVLKKTRCFPYGHLDHVSDGKAVHLDGKTLRPKSRTATGRARDSIQIASRGFPPALFDLRPLVIESVCPPITFDSESSTRRTGPVGTVKRKHSRGDIRITDATVDTSGLLTEYHFPFAIDFNPDHSVGLSRGQFKGIGQPASNLLFYNEPVNDHINRVLLVLVERDRLLKIQEPAIDSDSNKPFPPEVFQLFSILTLFPSNDGGEEDHPGSLWKSHEVIANLLECLRGYLPSAAGTVWLAHPGK